MLPKLQARNESKRTAKHNNVQTPLLSAALQYAAEGFRIVPCHSVRQGKCSCRRKDCPKPGKHPRVKDWPERASCDATQITKWLAKWPDANLGVATGAGSGIVVFDFDGAEGRSTLQQLAKDDPTILETRIHCTGSGGTHLLFRHPGRDCRNAVRRLPGMDIRGDCGLIILPPSGHVSGNRYAVQNEMPVAELPALLLDVCCPCHKERLSAIRSDQESQRTIKQVVQREEVSSRKMPYVPRERIEWALRESLPITQGRRNQQVFELARHLQAIEGITQDVSVILFRQIVEQWYRMAVEQAARLRFSIAGDLEEAWTDFLYGWSRVKHPIGKSLRPVFDHVARMDAQGEVEPIVWNSLAYFRRTEDRSMRLLIGVLFELSECAGDEPFSLACNAGAVHFARFGFSHIDSKWILRRLSTMAEDGILVCVDRGKAGPKGVGQVAKYRWNWSQQEPPPNEF